MVLIVDVLSVGRFLKFFVSCVLVSVLRVLVDVGRFVMVVDVVVLICFCVLSCVVVIFVSVRCIFVVVIFLVFVVLLILVLLFWSVVSLLV